MSVKLGTDLGYHDWRSSVVDVRGRRFTIFAKPGMTAFHARDEAAFLLAEQARIESGEIILNLNGGDGTVGATLATLAVDGTVCCASSSVLDVEAMRRTVAAAQLTNVRTYHSGGTEHVDNPGDVDVVAARLPKGRRPGLRIIRDAYFALRSGGRFYLAGGNDDGIQSALKRVDAQFGQTELLAYRHGCRVAVAVKSNAGATLIDELADPLLEPGRFFGFEARVRGMAVAIRSRPGVFAWDKLDDGSRALVETMEVRRDDRVLDLGCGTGVVGVVAERLAGSGGTTCLVDANVEAVDSARETLDANDVGGCGVAASDVGSAVRDQRFDVVVANPPFHVGRSTETDVALAFIADAAALLDEGGRLFLVANGFLAYEEAMRACLVDVRSAFSDRRYKVLVGRKGRAIR